MTVAQPDLLSLVASKHRDGTVVLSATHDRIFKLNGVGALTWTILERSETPLSLDELVGVLSARFDNSALKDDTTRFVNNLVRNGLLQVFRDPSGRESYRVAKNTSATTSTTVAAESDAAPEETVANVVAAPASQSRATQITMFETLSAFFGLLAFDLLLRFRGFEALIKKVENWPIREPRNTDPEICRHVCAAVNHAQIYYPKKAMCLQHSAVVTCFMRRRAVPAEMVLAAQEFPPKAHAWVEVAGKVLNDSQQVKTRYRELRRI